VPTNDQRPTTRASRRTTNDGTNDRSRAFGRDFLRRTFIISAHAAKPTIRHEHAHEAGPPRRRVSRYIVIPAAVLSSQSGRAMRDAAPPLQFRIDEERERLLQLGQIHRWRATYARRRNRDD
jgi:hypothetical protein